MTKLDSQIDDLQKAVARLDDVLRQEKTEFIRDAAIQRFEIVFDLAWKTLKNYLEEYCNVVCNSPKACFKEGFLQGILEYEDFWLKLTSDRNYTAHIYKEQMAEMVFADLPMALENFKKLVEKISVPLK